MYVCVCACVCQSVCMHGCAGNDDTHVFVYYDCPN